MRLFSTPKETPEETNARTLRKAVRQLEYDTIQNNYFYDYTNGIKNWSNHLSNTRQFINDCARRCFGRRTCVVLGSGYCLDVPVLELSRMFDNVLLVDIVHPKHVIKKTREFSNVKIITEDITKIAVETHNCINRYKDFAADVLICSPNYSIGNYSDILNDFDFVISVNTLSFLSQPIIKYLAQLRLVDDISATALQTFMQQYHINMLPKGKSCIISPISEKLYNSDGLQMYDKSIAYISKEVIRDPKEWTWNYSQSHTERIEYGVKAWEY